MKPLFLLLSILVIEARGVRAQWPDFGVYHTMGTVKCLSAKGGGLQVVHKGSWIYTGDKLILADDKADIILFTRDSNYIHLKGKGSYTTDDLQTIQRSHVRDNITSRYLGLLWEELFRPGADGETKGSTGGVSRGLSLVLAPAEGYKTSLDRLLFRWQRVAWATGYRLDLSDSAGQPAYESMTGDTQLVVSVRPPLRYGQTYHWSLELLGDEGRHQLGDTGRIGLVDEAKVLPRLAAVAPRVADSALLVGIDAELLRAELYERQGCMRAADRVYRQLMTAQPGDKAVRALYREFRRRNYADR